MEYTQGSSEEAASGQESPQEFARRLDLPFTDNLLLSRALTHRSFINEHPDALEDNERLGVSRRRRFGFPGGSLAVQPLPRDGGGRANPDALSFVRTDQLADFARSIDLGLALRLGRGELGGGGRDRQAVLCAGFEALVGALYLNSGIATGAGVYRAFLAPGCGRNTVIQ